MLIRSEGVGLRLQNRRERGKNKKQRTKMHFVSAMLSKIVCLGGGAGRSINSGVSACPMCAHDQTCYNFLEDFL